MNATTTTDEKLPSWRGEQKHLELFHRMRIYEEAFKRCDRRYSDWHRLQEELGMVYREVMKSARYPCCKAEDNGECKYSNFVC